MTNGGRLERIKKKHIGMLNLMDEYGFAEVRLQAIYNDMSFLIEQAERTQQLEKGIRHWEDTSLEFSKENARLRDALYTSKDVLRDAIRSLDVGEKVNGLEFALIKVQKALAGETNGQRKT